MTLPVTPTDLSWLQVLLASSTIPGIALVGGGLWKVWIWYHGRSDARETTSLTLQERIQQATTDANRRADARTEWFVDRQKELLVECEARLVLVEEDRTRGWDIARHWYWLYREMVHELRASRAAIGALGRRLINAGLMKDDDMPRFEIELPAIVPDIEAPFPRPGKSEGSV